MKFDYIIVGAGSSGSVLAARLSENREARVLLLEAGGSDRRARILIPGYSMLNVYGSKHDWGFISEPDPTRGDRSDYMPRGKVLGGTTSINAMSFVRGSPEDFDQWAALGCSGWDFDSVLPYFKRSENYEGGANEYRGVGGPLHVSRLRSPHALSEAFLQSCENAGMKRTEDYNCPPQEGIGFVQGSIKNGWRFSAARAYVWPAKHRSNLTVRTHSHVERVIFEDKRAVGVEYTHNGNTVRSIAEKAVILSAGVFGSPQILMLSGVGPARHLSGFEISVTHNLPGVGENFQDHAAIEQSVGVNYPTYNVQTGILDYISFGLQWMFSSTGPISNPLAEVVGVWHSNQQDHLSRVQYLFTPAGYNNGAQGPELHAKPTVTGYTNLHWPHSKGWVRLRSKNPMDSLMIQPNLFSDERDLDALMVGGKFQRKIFQTRPISQYVVEERSPDSNVQTDDEWRAFIRETAMGIYHPAGTCKMGNDKMAVVDEKLRVRGVSQLYVVDASIMPFVVSANLNANCLMIGEKAADMIKSDSR